MTMLNGTPNGDIPDEIRNAIAGIENQYQSSGIDRKNAPARLSVILERCIRAQDGPVDVLTDKRLAWSRLNNGNTVERFAGLLTLTFYWKESSDKFQSAIFEILRKSEPSEFRTLAITAAGNHFEGSADAAILKLLHQIDSELPGHPAQSEAVQFARARILGSPMTPKDPAVRGLLKKYTLDENWLAELKRKIGLDSNSATTDEGDD